MIDASLSTFERDVLDASRDAPVLVDFWAPWCGPCRSLGPMLEKLEREYGGRFQLVKVNSDDNPELSSQLNVRSVPHVVAFVGGEPVAQFVGEQPEGTLRVFLDQLVPNPSDVEHRAAREALVTGQLGKAESHLKVALALDPSNDGARLDLAAIALEAGQLTRAQELFQALSSKAARESTYRAVRAALTAAERAVALPSVTELQQRVALAPGDLQARMDLAELHVARREFTPALELLLGIVRQDRAFGDDAARRQMIAVFEMAAADPDLVTLYRRKLSNVLF